MGGAGRAGVVGHQAAGGRGRSGLLLDLRAAAARCPPAPDAELRPYQRAGSSGSPSCGEHGLGGILADDMGLGKTLQTLALIVPRARARAGRAGPFLVVAPTSVVSNWAAEAARFAPELRWSPSPTRGARRGGRSAEPIAGADVVVTSYALLRLDYEAYAGADWAGLILDEAQFVKNHQSKTYQCARAAAPRRSSSPSPARRWRTA